MIGFIFYHQSLLWFVFGVELLLDFHVHSVRQKLQLIAFALHFSHLPDLPLEPVVVEQRSIGEAVLPPIVIRCLGP